MGNKQSTTTTRSDVIAAPQNHDRKGSRQQPKATQRSGVLLRGCKTIEEDRFTRGLMIQVLRRLKGEDGLIAAGMEYRSVVLRDDSGIVLQNQNSSPSSVAVENTNTTFESSCQRRARPDYVFEEEKKEENPHTTSISCQHQQRQQQHSPNRNIGLHYPCRKYKYKRMTRLFHRESNTMITQENRKEFIADGPMYDIVCRLAMEYAQEVMMRDAQLEWVTIPQEADTTCANNENKSSTTTSSTSITEPIRALVSTRLVRDESRIDKEPTLLIATGNGQVRAGVFSRQHLLTSGLECSSAVPFVREAHKRKMNLVVLDPNAHGDRVGMVTFEKSMKHLFRRWEEDRTQNENETPVVDRNKGLSAAAPPATPTQQRPDKNLYVLSHSQSGSQFVRYLLDKSHCYLPRICATAFTDSTHNIQWTKRKEHLDPLKKLLESDECIYFKRSNEDENAKMDCKRVLHPLSTVGQAVDTDKFWKHRFGEIKTLCAGTSEHSLTNWFVRYHIWDHFNRLMVANNNRAT